MAKKKEKTKINEDIKVKEQTQTEYEEQIAEIDVDAVELETEQTENAEVEAECEQIETQPDADIKPESEFIADAEPEIDAETEVQVEDTTTETEMEPEEEQTDENIAEQDVEDAQVETEISETAELENQSIMADQVEETAAKTDKENFMDEMENVESLQYEDGNATESNEQIKESESETEAEQKFEGSLDEVSELVAEPKNDTKDVEEIKAESSAPVKKEKKDNFFKKHKKLTAIIAAILVLLIGGGITTFILLKDNIYVSSQQDIDEALAKNKVGNFILKNDINYDGDLNLSSAYKINLKGYKLTVTGTFTFNPGDSAEEIFIGTNIRNKKKQAQNPGSIEANKFVFNGNNAELEINAPLAATDISLNFKTLTANDLIANNLTLSGTKATANCIKGLAEGEAELIVNNMPEGVTVGALKGIATLGSTVDMTVSCSATEIVGGKTITVQVGAKVGKVQNSAKLLVAPTAEVDNVTNVAEVFFQEKLQTPDTIVFTNHNNTPYIFVNSINNATGYSYKINDYEGISDSNTFVIGTELVPGEYTISIKAINATDPQKYLDSDYFSYKFTYTAQLAAPNLVFSGTELGISEVAHADYFAVSINGGEEIKVTDSKIDIATYFNGLGVYSVKVIARSNTSFYAESEAVYISYINTAKLATPIPVAAVNDDGTYTVSWEAVEGAKRYKVVYLGHTVYVTGTSLTLETENISTIITSVSITAEGNEYYSSSDAATINPSIVVVP